MISRPVVALGKNSRLGESTERDAAAKRLAHRAEARRIGTPVDEGGDVPSESGSAGPALVAKPHILVGKALARGFPASAAYQASTSEISVDGMCCWGTEDCSLPGSTKQHLF